MISSLWFGIWVTLFRLEFEYASLNVGKNKFGLNFFIWNMQAWTAKINLDLNVGKNKSGLKFFFFFWLGHELGPIPKRGPQGPVGAGSSLGKKPGTLNGSGPDMEKPNLNSTRCHSYLLKLCRHRSKQTPKIKIKNKKNEVNRKSKQPSSSSRWNRGRRIHRETPRCYAVGDPLSTPLLPTCCPIQICLQTLALCYFQSLLDLPLHGSPPPLFL